MARILRNRETDGLLLFLCALGILTVPFRWMAAVVTGVLVHEFGHLICLFLLGVPVQSVEAGLSGARIVTWNMSPRQEFLAAFAGPLFSFGLLSLSKVYPELAVCGLAQGFINLLPVYPSDGGRMMSAALWKIPWERRKKYLRYTGLLICLTLLFGELILFFLLGKQMLYILILSGMLFWSWLRNIPCKDATKEVK